MLGTGGNYYPYACSAVYLVDQHYKQKAALKGPKKTSKALRSSIRSESKISQHGYHWDAGFESLFTHSLVTSPTPTNYDIERAAPLLRSLLPRAQVLEKQHLQSCTGLKSLNNLCGMAECWKINWMAPFLCRVYGCLGRWTSDCCHSRKLQVLPTVHY